MKILVGVNTLTSVDNLAYSNHCQMWYRMGKNHPDIDFALNTPHRASIDRMRNQSARVALQWEADYVLFLDDDVLVPPDGLKKLLEADLDIVAGWTIIRGHPYENMFFEWTSPEKVALRKIRGIDPKREEVLPCDAVGFSFCLIKTELFRKVPAPFFVTGTHNTEDIYFCVKAQQYAPGLKIGVHLGIKTAHILGSEIIDPMNRESYKKFYEESYPDFCKPEDVENRGDEYLVSVKELTEAANQPKVEEFHVVDV